MTWRIMNPPPSGPMDEAYFNSLSELEKRGTAWKYHGYRSLSKWMASSNDFFILRKFSTLSARSLLYLQNEISQREQRLEAWDQWTMKLPPGQGGCASFKSDIHSPRAELLNELIPLLEKYYNLVNSFSQVRSQPIAPQRRRQNLRNWLDTWPNAIDQEEQHLFDPLNERDLFQIYTRPKTPLKALLERIPLIRRWFRGRRKVDQIVSQSTEYHNNAALDMASGILIVFVGLMMFFGPLWWLNYVTTDVYRLGIITGSVSFFAAWLWMAAGNRSFEILAGTAAYAAVLIVYLQIQKDN